MLKLIFSEFELSATKRSGRNGKRARLYHLSDRTIQQIDTLAIMYGTSKEHAVAEAVELTYKAAAEALAKMKVKVPSPPSNRTKK
jgi:hypothetical protein